MVKLFFKSFQPFRFMFKTVFPIRTLNSCGTSIRTLSSEPIDLEFSFHSPVESPPLSQSPLIILHGLLGCRLNWRTLANVIASRYQKQVYTLDARNHGDSPHSKNFDYPIMAMDVTRFMQKKNISRAIVIGHSMGGRTAMTIALTHPDLVAKLIIVDVSPKKMPDSSNTLHAYVLTMKDELVKLPKNVNLSEARQILNDSMASAIPEMSIRQFLLTNLATNDDGGFRWKANVTAIAENFFTSISNFPSLTGTYNGATLFICGGNSPYVKVEDHDYIRTLFPQAEFVYVSGAGHWVHSEKPQEFLTAVEKFL